MGIVASVAGSPVAQTTGAEVDRARHERTNQQRQVESLDKAEAAAGIGQTEEEHQSEDRDADGRRLWEETARKAKPDDADHESDASPLRQSRDPTGQSGGQLDLTG
jgi:hypothetical protein